MSANPAGKEPSSPLTNSPQACAQDAESLDLHHSELMDQAYDEYCQLVERGEAVDLDEFCGRYPGLEQSVRRQIEIHNVIQEQPSLFHECCEVLWPQPGDHVMGFQLSEELGRGSFSRVFQASDTMLGERQVVIKVSQSGAHESRILGKLEHDNIVPVHSSQPDLISGLTLICMPFLGRTTLRDVIASTWKSKRPPVRASEILAVGRTDNGNLEHAPEMLKRGRFVEGVIFVGAQIAQALAHAHKEGILHLDLKPSNVLMASGRPKILDFNLATDRDKGLPPMGGTPPYMSPEQAQCFLHGRDARALDGRSDIFSLGVVLHEMLCGQLPYDRLPDNAPQSSGNSTVYELYSNLRVLCAGSEYGRLGRIIERCLVIDPDERYQSADELAAELQRELSTVRRGKRWIRTHRRTVLAAMGMAIVLGICAAVGIANRDPYPEREFTKGAAHFERGEYPESIEHLTNSIQADPQPEALFMRAKAHIAEADYKRAIDDLRVSHDQAEDGQKCALIGYCYNRIESHAGAASWYLRAIDHGFGPTTVYNNLGITHYLRGRYGSAIRELRVAVGRNDMPRLTLVNRAIVWHADAEREGVLPVDAIADIEAVISLGQCTAEIYHCAGTIYQFASTLEDKEFYSEKANKYFALARELGMPESSIRGTVSQKSLFAEPTSDTFGEVNKTWTLRARHHSRNSLE